MTDDKRERPTFIRATNVKGLVMKDNVGIGDVDFADLKNVEGLEASGNIHITPKAQETPRTKVWYERPFGILALTIIGGVGVGGLLYLFGWI